GISRHQSRTPDRTLCHHALQRDWAWARHRRARGGRPWRAFRTGRRAGGGPRRCGAFRPSQTRRRAGRTRGRSKRKSKLMSSDILIIDDEADIRELVSGILQDEGHQVRVARNSDEAIDAVRRRRPSLVVLDIWLQDSALDGLDLLTVFKEIDGEMPVVVIS